MATNFWKCEICYYVGPTKEFGKAGDRQCPNPEHGSKSREDVFPYRLYRCDLCAHEDGHDHFFGRETPIDDDPLELGRQATCG